ncbi:hypothetical protein CPB84DRAFT_1745063 [Gymnopilus junonius]|uniref:Lysine-specific metallo-endopeptidase domain-containing protein n=1 Tax=Gymnopilus junonius TaxID=109634 RepID=A0A9P5TPW4_GYMJU|nr:hypothetical protein CPB84DRAFT_1745063 [Gymnopilus junonius]
MRLQGLIYFSSGIAAISLKFRLGDGGSDANKQKVKGAALKTANRQIGKMETVLNRPNPQSEPAVVAAFGENANIDEIKKHVQTLKTGKILVLNAEPANGVTQGATATGNKHVTFGNVFYGSTDKERAGTLIHEASHALNSAVDHFKKDGTPYAFGGSVDKSNALVGYKDSHMGDLHGMISKGPPTTCTTTLTLTVCSERSAISSSRGHLRKISTSDHISSAALVLQARFNRKQAKKTAKAAKAARVQSTSHKASSKKANPKHHKGKKN